MGQDAARLQGLKPRALPAGSVAAKAATYKAVATAGAQGTVGGGLDLREDAESNSSGAKAQRSDDRSVGAPRSWGSTEASIPGGEYISSVAKTDRSEDRPLGGSTAEASTFRAAESLGATQETEVATAAPPLSDPGQGLLRDRRELGSRTPKSVAVQAALLTLNFYKVWLSPWLAGSCRYEPTCSRYAYEAIERFGVARGLWLGTKRLLRCHPFTKRFGYDPVPEKWEEMRREESKSIFSGAKARENGNDYVGTKAPTLSGEHILLQVEEAGRPLPSPGQAKDRRLQGGVRS